MFDGVEPSKGFVWVGDFVGDVVAKGAFGFPVAAEVWSKCDGQAP
jgi:hypothetical protein